MPPSSCALLSKPPYRKFELADIEVVPLPTMGILSKWSSVEMWDSESIRVDITSGWEAS